MATHGPVSSSRVEKVAQRLRKRIEDGEFYEGLQTYKALYSRYRAQGKEQQAVDLVYEGAVILLEHSQVPYLPIYIIMPMLYLRVCVLKLS